MLVGAPTDAAPWRLADALKTPDWLSIRGSHRTRYESLNGQYRGLRHGGDQALMLRTLVEAQVRVGPVKFVAELEDSRAELTDSGTPISTTMVNPVELLQAYATVKTQNFLGTGSNGSIRAGRLTMDVGSRRFVARNLFRNTLNAFTGVDWQWTSVSNRQFRAFFTLPVQRLVDRLPGENRPKFDTENDDVRFWGLYYAPPELPWGDRGEIYLFGLDEQDIERQPSRDRELYTAGFRVYRTPKQNALSYQIESVYQWGTSRTSTTSTMDLDHWAHFHHIEIGYTFDAPMAPQLLIQYDFASGDDDPTDGDNNRFDTLFGSRRFDFGPTSIYGAFTRANLSTPGIRLKLKPYQSITSFLALRGFWLADTDDAWTTADIRNPAGRSESFVGTQIEARLRWNPIPKNVRIEAGFAHLFASDLMDTAGKNDSTYVYSQAVISF